MLMGDGFIDTEINDGTYDAVMDKAFENLLRKNPSSHFEIILMYMQ